MLDLWVCFYRARRQVGSHATYRLGDHIVTIPFRKPYVLPVYVKGVLEILDEMDASADVL